MKHAKYILPLTLSITLACIGAGAAEQERSWMGVVGEKPADAKDTTVAVIQTTENNQSFIITLRAGGETARQLQGFTGVCVNITGERMPDGSIAVSRVERTGFVDWMLANALYAGLVLTLVLCGLGLPIPEEFTFLAAGYYGKDHGGSILGLCICGLIGIMLGDSIPFFLGRHYGMTFLTRSWVSKLIKPHHIEKTKLFFEKRGAKAIFIARFLAGLRMPTFFMAGAMGVSYWTFGFWDMLGALISCPVSIWLAFTFGSKAEEYLRKGHIYVFGALAALFTFVLLRWLFRRKKRTGLREPPTALNSSSSSLIEATTGLSTAPQKKLTHFE